MDGVTEDQTLRLQRAVHTLIEKGALSLKNGTVTLSFDFRGELMSIRFDAVVWKQTQDRGTVIDGPLHKELKGATIKVNPKKPQTMGGTANPHRYASNPQLDYE